MSHWDRARLPKLKGGMIARQGGMIVRQGGMIVCRGGMMEMLKMCENVGKYRTGGSMN